MSYIYNVIIIIFIIYIICACLKPNHEGFKTQPGKDLSKYILEQLNNTSGRSVTIKNYDYDLSNVCKTDNYHFSNSIKNDDFSVSKCKTYGKIIEKKNDKTLNKEMLPSPKEAYASIGNDKATLSINNLRDTMNCYLWASQSNIQWYKKNAFTNDTIQKKFAEDKYTLTDHTILASYNSSCVSYDGTHDLSQITFLFNLGIRYFDFTIIFYRDNYYVSTLPDRTDKLDKTPTLLLTDVIETLYENIENHHQTTTNFNELKDPTSITPGSPNHNDPLIINFNICIKELRKKNKDIQQFHFKKIYNVINQHGTRNKGKFIDHIYIKKNITKSQTDNILSVPIHHFKNKVILFFDIYSFYLGNKTNPSPDELNNLYESFTYTQPQHPTHTLASITSCLVYDNKYKQQIQGLSKKYRSTSHKNVIKDTSDNLSQITDSENEFRIVIPENPTICKVGQKKNTYLCDAMEHINRGANIVSFPFYLADNTDTLNNLLKYYNFFNGKYRSAIVLKNAKRFLAHHSCHVSVSGVDVSATHHSSNNIESINKRNEKSTSRDKAKGPSSYQREKTFTYIVK
jgi:hypothetical protein